MFSLSLRWFVHALLSLWVVDRRSPGPFATPHPPPCLGLGSWCFVTTLTNSLGLSSLYAVVATHFDLVCWCFFSVFFFGSCSFLFFRRAAGTTKGIFARRSKLIASQSDLLASFCFLCPAAGKGEHCTFFYNVALFSSSCSMDVKVVSGVVLGRSTLDQDPNLHLLIWVWERKMTIFSHQR